MELVDSAILRNIGGVAEIAAWSARRAQLQSDHSAMIRPIEATRGQSMDSPNRAMQMPVKTG